MLHSSGEPEKIKRYSKCRMSLGHCTQHIAVLRLGLKPVSII